LTDRWPSR